VPEPRAARLNAFSVFTGVRLHAVLGDPAASYKDLGTAARLYEDASVYQMRVLLACAVAFVVWFVIMRRATGPLAPDRFRHGPGWALGGWFVPVANLFFPYRIALDMWNAATQLPGEDEPFRARTWPVSLWWSLFVSSTLLSRIAGMLYNDAGTSAGLSKGVTLYLVADAVDIAAAAAAAYFAVSLTGMQRRKATEGWYRSPDAAAVAGEGTSAPGL
jgi:Domain of unknown function (DUF4328)